MKAYYGVYRVIGGWVRAMRTVLIIAVVVIFGYSGLYAEDVSVAWSPVSLNEDGSTITDLDGYRLYYGISSGSYNSSLDVGKATSATVSNLGDGRRYYFSVTAYSSTGSESAYSDEASWLSPDLTPPLVSCPDTVTVTAELDGTASVPDLRSQASVSDNVTAVADIQVTQSPAAGSSVGIGTTVATLTALDEAGNSSDCTVDIIVTAATPPEDATAPSVRITTPSTDTMYVTTESTVTIGGTASDDTAVTQVRYSGSAGSGTCTGTDNWIASSLALAAGDNVFTVTALDAAGNTGTDSLTVHLQYITITSPVVGEVSLAWSPVALNDDGSTLTDLAGYKLYYGHTTRAYEDSFNVGNVTTITLSDLTDGYTYYFAVTAYSTSGNESDFSTEASIAFPDITPPLIACPSSVSITAGISGTASIPDLRSQASVSDNSTAATDIQVTQSPAAGSSAGIGTTVATLTALDEAGNSSDCTVDITVTAAAPPADDTAPSVRITTPSTETMYVTTESTITIGGTASDDTAVTQVRYSGSAGSGTCTGTDNWSISGLALAAGNNVFTITATDASGNSDTDTITVRLSTEMTVLKPAADTVAYAGGTILVEWTGSPAPGSLDIELRDTTNEIVVLTNNMVAAASEGSAELLLPRGVERGTYRIAVKEAGATDGVVLSSQFIVVRNERPTLKWDMVNGATEYRVWIGRDGSKYFDRTLVQNTTSWTPVQRIPDGTYEWWTRAYVPGAKRQKWVRQGLFSIPYSEHPRRPKFDWDAEANATWYQIWLGTDNEEHVDEWLEQTRTTWTPTTNLTDGTYGWWTRAYVPKVGSSAWIDHGQITIPYMMNARRPTLDWDPTVEASWYQLWLNKDGTNYIDMWLEQTHTTWVSETDLPGGTYAWWTRAYVPDSGNSKWITHRTFTVPIDYSAVTPTFSWNTVRKATWYRIQITRNGTLHHDEWLEQTGNTWTPSAPLPEGTYSWKIDPYVSGSESAGWIDMGTFEVP